MSTPTPPTDHSTDSAEHPVIACRSYDDYLLWLDRVLGTAGPAANAADMGAASPERLATMGGTSPEGTRTWATPAGATFVLPHTPGQRFQPFAEAPEVVVLPAGSLVLGAADSDPDAEANEHPRRHITLTRPIAMGLAPVTFAQWDACLADDGTRHRPGDATWGRGNRPVMNVSWHDAEEYCGWLARKTGLRWRLPSEAEWTWACWAGQPQEARYPWGADAGARQLRHHAWFSDNAGLRTQPVGQLQANAWGLVDTLGNVAEWVADAHHPDLSQVRADGSPFHDDQGHANRIIKGGSWLESARTVRPSARDHVHPDHRSYRVGFRVVVELPFSDRC